ncbi:MAG: capsular polysaccharide biosynthesis protein [Aliishimia sp.]
MADLDAAGEETLRRLFVYNGGFLTQTRIKRILALKGYKVTLGKPDEDGLIGIWGMSPTSHRGETVAQKTGASILRVEDAWLRSIFPGREDKSPPTGLLLDQRGVHFDPSHPSDLEVLLANEPLDDTALLNRARGCIARMIEGGLTKYTGFDPAASAPKPGYVLVIDQTDGDASVTASGADLNTFREMLYYAQEEHPGARILIKTHPETIGGHRPGYFADTDCTDRITMVDQNLSPWALFEGAIAVYTVSSQMGFEAIFAGHKPRVFGQPFYAGWGLTQDEFPVQRRQRILTRAQLFAAAMLMYPTWYDPNRDRLCSYEDATEALFEETRAWRADRDGWVASGMRLWKRAPLNTAYGRYKPMIFEDDPVKARATQRPWMVWAGKAEIGHQDAVRVEDGFLRSRGLGAELVPAMSLVTDDLGIYYDPRRPSRLEKLIESRVQLRPDQIKRAQGVIRALTGAGLSKYNLGKAAPDLPEGTRILVPGQVEDDASILTGADHVSTNQALLEAARASNPTAILIYKPHPDVEAGLRPGAIDAEIADIVLQDTDPATLLKDVNEVWTMTSLLGFEALLRDVKVTTLGAPFYAGWGLTTDLGTVPPRRRHDVPLEGLVHAALIDYPRYFDPVTGRPCPVEIVIERLASGAPTPRAPTNRLLAKLQGLLSSYSHLWRRG